MHSCTCIKSLVVFLVWLAFIEVGSWCIIAGDLILADGIEFLFLGGYATDAFEDVGHSTDAKELMKTYLIGKMAEGSIEPVKEKIERSIASGDSSESSWISWGVPLIVALLATYAYRYFTSSSNSNWVKEWKLKKCLKK